jgi:glycosyltransferase involved in cell wall biosynthesis
MRKLQRVIYTSSYDRGLEHLLGIWPEVKKAVPKAELHVFYGWQLFDIFFAHHPASFEWKQKLVNKMKELGVVDHGRLPQPDLKKFMQGSGVWAYPTHFGETNCISGIKAQAYGCEPVVSDYAALHETVQFGRKVKGDIYTKRIREKFKKELIDALKHPMTPAKRKTMMAWAKKKYSWNTIARQWGELFKQSAR